MSGFLNEMVGAISQLLVFSFIPFVWWFFTARKNRCFFNWIGMKRIVHDKKVANTLLGVVFAGTVYCTLTYLCIYFISDQITVAGSQFAGMEIGGIPLGLVTQDILVVIFLTILPGAFGWYQGWLNEKRCGGSIISSWLLHGTMNFIVTCLSL